MRIALATQHVDRAFIPLALMYLKASLVGRGCSALDEVVMLEFGRRDSTADAIAAALIDARPDIVGLSCYVWNVTTTLAAARLVKAQAPATLIVLGGPEVGPVAADVLRRHPYVDAIVYSEGEVPFADIVEAWQAERGLDGVPGICFPGGARIVETGPARPVKDLGDYPSPHIERYVDYARRIVSIETQRGCAFQCNFCFYDKDYSLRNRPVDLDPVQSELLA